MTVLRTYSFEDIEFLYKILKIKTLPFGDGVPIGSVRMNMFMKNRRCVHCGIVGDIFRLEIDNGGNYQFNLYSTNKFGYVIMMTRDHIVPKSRGGSNGLSNSQTLCTHCNHKKGNKLESELSQDKYIENVV